MNAPTGGLLLVRTVLSEQIAWLASLRRRPSRDARLVQLRNALRIVDDERQLRLPLAGYEPNADHRCNHSVEEDDNQ